MKDGSMQYRYENFGGIIAGQDPPFLAYVDRDYMRQLGLKGSSLWETADESIGLLSAPTEVHFSITNRCSAGCDHCYMEAGQADDNELDTDTFKKALDVLAEMKVFHVALGGGDALERNDLFEVAAYAREKGIVPNLTISGINLTDDIARQMHGIFGQVNVSVDGLGSHYGIFRGKDLFAHADKALDRLTREGVSTGINCVLGRENFEMLEDLFAYASEKKLNEIEFLGLKPSGRGRHVYMQQRTTDAQNAALTPKLAELSEKYGITAKIDCSFVPMLCYHNPPREVLESMATYGCEAGNVLLGARSDGSISGCSFLPDSGISIFDLPDKYGDPQTFSIFRDWTSKAPQPCCDCDYLDICKGGCHGVAQFVSGSFEMPDPDCPFVVDHLNKDSSDG
ncbi:MAG: radical SAM protein [Phycisphaerae bacterium]|nr:radical SAM protein [Phycisphaerae bacterium]